MSGIRKPCLLKIALIFQKTFEHPNFQFFHEKGMVQITFLPLLRMCLDIRKHSPVFQKHMLIADGYHDHKNIEYNDDYDDGCEKH